MNRFILMCGSIILLHLLLVVIAPSYDKKKHPSFEDEAKYNRALNLGIFLISLAINFLTWGWFV